MKILAIIALAVVLPALGETPAADPAQTATPPPSATSFWTRGGVNISGVVDAFYSYNSIDPGLGIQLDPRI